MPDTQIISTYTFRGVTIEVMPGVFTPNKTTDLLLEAALERNLKGKRVLDLGCGSGVVGCCIKALGDPGSVHGSDISDQAAANAKHNAKRLGLDIDFRQGSLFVPWNDMKFDAILDDVSGVAEPIARLSPWYPPEIHCDAGLDGSAMTIQMLEAAAGHLNPGGVLFLPVVSLSNETKILEVARSRFSTVECLLRKSWPIKEDFWKRISASDTCRKLIDEGIIKVVQRGSRWLWDTSIYLCVSG